MLVIGKKNKNGFTLIELLLVLSIIGIASSYIVLNTSVLNFIKYRDDTIENNFELLAEESILIGKTIHWHASKSEDRFLILNPTDELFQSIEIDGFNLLPKISQEAVIEIKTASGSSYKLDRKVSETPLISFYPSGQNSGGIISIKDNNQTTKIVISQNGHIFKELENE